MHKIFRKALDTATGEQHSIIAVIIDIRNFSPFSLQQDSFDIAMFLKRVYMNIIDSYFDFASFYKSTGDGLLLTIPFSANNLKEMAQKTIVNCIACHREFSNICRGDPMIHFPTPDKIGIGVARGSACCLIAGSKGRKIIDYSGRLLNLTSRLTALAKPSGVIIDQGFDIDLLNKNTRQKFTKQDIYLDGVAENKPITIYFTKEYTKIPKHNRRPIAQKRWRHRTDVTLLSDIVKFKEFIYDLKSEPTSAEDIEVTIEFPKIIEGEPDEKYESAIYFNDFTYKLSAGKPTVILNYEKIYKLLKKAQVEENMEVIIDIAYIEK